MHMYRYIIFMWHGAGSKPENLWRHNIFLLFQLRRNANRVLAQLVLCSVLSEWIHNKIRLPLTVLTCLRRLNWGDYLFITHAHSLCRPPRHTHKNKLVMSGHFVKRSLHPSLNDRKLLLAGLSMQPALPEPICFTCEHPILQGFADFKWQIVPKFALLSELYFARLVWVWFCVVFSERWPSMTEDAHVQFPAGSADSPALFPCGISFFLKVYLKGSLLPQTTSLQGVIYVASLD